MEQPATFLVGIHLAMESVPYHHSDALLGLCYTLYRDDGDDLSWVGVESITG